MRIVKQAVSVIVLAGLAGMPSVVASQETVRLGAPVTEEQLAEFDLIVGIDGAGFPAGGGTASEGKAIYDTRCAACHGINGEGTSAITVLAGGDMQSEGPPLRTVGSYWPYATTVFDFVRRAMPADAPKSLSDEEVYQVVAYILYMNGIVGENEVLNAETLPVIRMPNADGFIDRSHIH